MSHFGDPEAHRRILEEMSGLKEGVRSFAYLRAAVMGSMGSVRALSALHDTPGLVQRPTRIMQVQLALLSVTVRAATGSPRYGQELATASEVLREVAGQAAKARADLRAGGDAVGTGHTPPAVCSFTSVPTATARPPFAAKSIAAAAAAAAAADADVPDDYLSLGMAYTNYLSGFTALWMELFGPHYFVYTRASGTIEGVAQVPPHLYAVNWQCLLTPERQAWCKGLHDTAREALRLIVTRAIPLECYGTYVLCAGLSLRLRLLETAAETFTWSSLFVDVPYCTRQLYVSYRTQCEYARLQDVWRSFHLFDDAFTEDCARFNLACSAAQGAFFESPQEAEPSAPMGSGRVPRDGQLPPQSPQPTGGRPTRVYRRSRTASTLSATGRVLDAGAAGEPHRPTALARAAPYPGEPPSPASSAEADSDAPLDDDDDEDDVGESSRRQASSRREVYMPVFHTQCVFTWLLQRMFWSLYGRCTLLFSSCVRLDLAPRLSEHGSKHCEALTAVDEHLWRAQETCGGPPTSSTRALSSTAAASRLSRSPPRLQRSLSEPRIPAPPAAPVSSGGAAAVHPTPVRLLSFPGRAWRALARTLAGARREMEGHVAVAAPVSAALGPDGVSLPSSFAPHAPLASAARLPDAPQPPFFLRYTWHRHAAQSAAEGVEGDGEVADGEQQGHGQAQHPLCSPLAYWTELSFLSMGGCYVLAHAIHRAMTSTRYPVTLLMLSDNTTRPGLRNWANHKYVISAIPDDPAERCGLGPWVLNFVLPRFRLSPDREEREYQESALLRSIVFEIGGNSSERIAFTHQDSLFYVLNGGPYMDQGRNYFVLHLHTRDFRADGYRSDAQLLRAEEATAFGGLEEVRLAWYMSCSCNEAIRLAAAVERSR